MLYTRENFDSQTMNGHLLLQKNERGYIRLQHRHIKICHIRYLYVYGSQKAKRIFRKCLETVDNKMCFQLWQIEMALTEWLVCRSCLFRLKHIRTNRMAHNIVRKKFCCYQTLLTSYPSWTLGQQIHYYYFINGLRTNHIRINSWWVSITCDIGLFFIFCTLYQYRLTYTHLIHMNLLLLIGSCSY